MMNTDIMKVGKLPPDILARILSRAPVSDPRVLLGPGLGLDCAVIDLGPKLLVMKSDPITFATDEIGWYSVQVCANDIATTGATPLWFLPTLLLPEGRTTTEMIDRIADQIFGACAAQGISVVGGHTEVTHDLDRPIVFGTLAGEVTHEKLVTPRGARPGNTVLLTKGVPVEATSLIAREFPDQLRPILGDEDLNRAAGYLYNPGISVMKDASLAVQAGRVTAMHDPTEGGLASAIWELAEACGHTLVVDPAAVPVPELSRRICEAMKLDPLAAIASGALLLTAEAEDAPAICSALEAEGIPCAEIGRVEEGRPLVWAESAGRRDLLPRPERDEIARLFS